MTSCKKEYEELIVGKWLINTEDGFADAAIFNHYIPEPIEHMDCWGFVFHDNGSGYSYEIVDEAEVVHSQVTYSIDGDNIHIIYGNGVHIKWTIEKIDKKRLELSERYDLTDSNGSLRYGFGLWNFDRKEYVAPVFPADTIVATDTIATVDTLAGQDTATTKNIGS
jgi:hypothetical protein